MNRAAPLVILATIVNIIGLFWFASLFISVECFKPTDEKSGGVHPQSRNLIGQAKPSLGAKTDATRNEGTPATEYQTQGNRSEKRMVWVTLGLLVIAIFQGGFFYWQLGLMREGLDDSKVASENGQRAWIGFSTPKGTVIDLAQWKFNVEIKNGGQTPAFDVHACINWTWFDGVLDDWPKDEPFTDHLAHIVGSKMMMIPGQTLPFVLRLQNHNVRGKTISECFDNFVTKDSVTIFFHAEVKYRDIFEKPRFSNYCFFLQKAAGGQITVNATKSHNDGD